MENVSSWGVDRCRDETNCSSFSFISLQQRRTTQGNWSFSIWQWQIRAPRSIREKSCSKNIEHWLTTVFPCKQWHKTWESAFELSWRFQETLDSMVVNSAWTWWHLIVFPSQFTSTQDFLVSKHVRGWEVADAIVLIIRWLKLRTKP